MTNDRFQVGEPDPETHLFHFYVWDVVTGDHVDFKRPTPAEEELAAREYARQHNAAYA